VTVVDRGIEGSKRITEPDREEEPIRLRLKNQAAMRVLGLEAEEVFCEAI